MSIWIKFFLGLAMWGVATWLTVPTLHDSAWAHALLLFAAIVLVPLLFDLAEEPADSPRVQGLWRAVRRWHFPSATLLLLAVINPQGDVAALCTIPWFGLTVILAVIGLMRVTARKTDDGARLCVDAGLIFSAIGGAWTLADRAAYQPLGFDPAIVTLTAVHFHFAGLVLPVLTGKILARGADSAFSRWIGRGIVLGVPLVAVGITSTQFAMSPAIEFATAWVLALSGIALGVRQVRLGLAPGANVLVNCGWVFAGLSLIVGMLLAGLYASRFYLPGIPWLDIPWMRAMHGTCNALGFAFVGTLAWWFEQRRVDKLAAG